MKEYFDVVDRNDKVIGRALRSDCHKNPKLIHRGIFVVVINDKGEILLQKRSKKKDLYGGLWGMSVGGHNRPGETYESAAKREMKEELGLKTSIRKIGKILVKQETETELDMMFEAKISREKIRFNKSEISEVKFFSPGEIKHLEPGQIIPDIPQIIRFYMKNK